jgi:hypothetical protein
MSPVKYALSKQPRDTDDLRGQGKGRRNCLRPIGELYLKKSPAAARLPMAAYHLSRD